MNYNKEELDLYINGIISHIFALLPTYEETGMTDDLKYRIKYVQGQVKTLLDSYDDFSIQTSLELLSYMSILSNIESHIELKKAVFRSCALLGELKAGDVNA
ncbi:hypothetical protein DW272_01605 [Blautia obeum]|uniref:Uncharacterized protein n=1 Tax=Blautia obeum TaxID=40520 RepID=A0A414SK35_9FIRM|nr:hypothetical protein [Blautia obeum]RHG19929.1 hypothetical protein DW272_01605 [Blautia obeum]DAG68627.1 MAG TPA: hypothetical protein [Caudoviricetes sp.]